MQVAIDGNILPIVASGRPEVLECFAQFKKRGIDIVLPPHAANEVARASEKKVKILIEAAQRVCVGLIDFPADELMRMELRESNPHAYYMKRSYLETGIVKRIPSIRDVEEVRRAHQDEKIEYDALREILPEFGKAVKARGMVPGKEKIDPFDLFVKKMRSAYLRDLLDHASRKGYIEKSSVSKVDLDKLWEVGMAYRFSTVVVLANEYRLLSGELSKQEGSMTDLRIAIECAYTDGVITNDREFHHCGVLASEVVGAPKFFFWPDVLASSGTVVK